ncbi:MAG: acyl carrier protein [Xanthomonadales bacterium]|nr:acyl carrier protein [Xanthomonadales bacterium]
MGEALREQTESLPSCQQLDRDRLSREPLERTRLDKIRRDKLEKRHQSLGRDGGEGEGKPIAMEGMPPDDRRLLRNDRAQCARELLAERYRRFPLTPDTRFRLDLGVDSLGWLDLSMDIAQHSVELSDDDITEIDTVRDMEALEHGE